MAIASICVSLWLCGGADADADAEEDLLGNDDLEVSVESALEGLEMSSSKSSSSSSLNEAVEPLDCRASSGNCLIRRQSRFEVLIHK